MTRQEASVRYAHSLEGHPPAEWQTLEEHLEQTARLAAEFARPFGASGWAHLAGLWHDLGKFSDDFQKRIGATDGSEAHIETRPGRVDHSTAGALHAVMRLGLPGRFLSYLIAGHHAGLPDWRSDESRGLHMRLEKTSLLDAAINGAPPSHILEQGFPDDKPTAKPDPALWIRMLYSCLVDADFLDTEAFMDPNRASARGGYPALEELLPAFDSFMEKKAVQAPDTTVNRVRARVLEQCRQAAAEPPGIFSLTVPTGGGKTLSSMAFALGHAAAHGKRRIIYVIPYTSIIEQTADVFRDVFGDAVLEHHSNIDVTDEAHENSRSRLATENWDAPLIVTTSVQFFESFFASRSSRCRKLHNVADSVIILDEAQLLPPEYLRPILRLLEELRRCYGVTIVLCTATQPALGRHESPGFRFEGLDGVREIIKDPSSLHRELKRVRVEIPQDITAPVSWVDLADELQRHPSVLCVVNSRRDCLDLFRIMPEGTFHLSALMCGAHRSEVIADIRNRLAEGIPTRVISTQLVEAGVDLDFPVVCRAIAGLDSIAQAGGRCNREGLLDSGLIKVFQPEHDAPPGHLRQAAGISRQILQDRPQDPLDPVLFERFFKELFWLKGDGLDKHDIMESLAPDREFHFSFRSAADKFHIIDDKSMAQVLVRYGEGAGLIDRLQKEGPHRLLLRGLQRYVVNIPRHLHRRLLASGDIMEMKGAPGIYLQSHGAMYDKVTGFQTEGVDAYAPDDLII